MYGELNPLGGGDSIPLLKTKLLVGRRPTCDICLPFPNVSSQHCELELKNGYWHVQDLGSRNGLKINGTREEARFLLPGDELSIAKHSYSVDYEPTSDEPPPVESDPFGQSLLEKAGLAPTKKRKQRENDRDNLIGDATTRPVRKKPRKKSNSQEDQILDWLEED